ncbi:hypothetical protein EDD65_10147 [Keratinibaculum paraultunense]|uniref:DUF192 domain-containing protein n=1 Tax=Keratinibaculum paraultunense TaxID=1278232 RepID=A0A4R3L2L6_9FIRM|nr:DUF192 domain-containing protein [Keratinibaculum paraultunense]QQY80132.1 DUF192 domain-containing protein [Keratinibaculum paraultunense]TCS91547.1 hypothetical protein EDD65_10147 [Keratinibaculum paraultunense]
MIKKIKIAANFWSRFRGLMFKNELPEDEALLFLNCSRVHTFFMKFDICVIYLDKDFNVIDYEVLKPWQIGSKVEGAKHLLEASSKVEPYIKDMTKLTIKVEGGYSE